jgi:polyhydroxyalkanoate synthesis regulator phasin
MNSDLMQLVQKSFRVTLGATATLLETLQDSQQRESNFSRLKQEFDQLAEQWEAKGSVTEQEARSFVDNLLNHPSQEPHPPTPPAEASSAPSVGIQQDLRDLTAQLASIRAELERLRASDS